MKIHRKFIFLSGFLMFLFTILIMFYESPRAALISDINTSNSIIILWDTPIGPIGDNQVDTISYKLDKHQIRYILQEITKNIFLDYSRGIATSQQKIYIYTLNKDDSINKLYVIRRARGGGGKNCPSMEAIRQIAKRGRQLFGVDAAKIRDEGLGKKYHSIINFDFVLPYSGSK